jgi:hypothetical protein
MSTEHEAFMEETWKHILPPNFATPFMCQNLQVIVKPLHVVERLQMRDL